MRHGKNYDAKNMMHVFRLLRMAKEIALEKRVNVHRADRGFLLDIREGKYEYEQLLEMADALKEELSRLYDESDLPVLPDKNRINQLLCDMRHSLYASHGTGK